MDGDMYLCIWYGPIMHTHTCWYLDGNGTSLFGFGGHLLCIYTFMFNIGNDTHTGTLMGWWDYILITPQDRDYTSQPPKNDEKRALYNRMEFFFCIILVYSFMSVFMYFMSMPLPNIYVDSLERWLTLGVQWSSKLCWPICIRNLFLFFWTSTQTNTIQVLKKTNNSPNTNNHQKLTIARQK